MNTSGSGYLLAIAGIAMTFVSLSAIVLVLRQFGGGALTPYHTHVVRFTVECGLLATASALLPVLLELTGLPLVVIYRIASGRGSRRVPGLPCDLPCAIPARDARTAASPDGDH